MSRIRLVNGKLLECGQLISCQTRERFDIPDGVELFDLGVLTMDMITYIDTCDVVITVDAMEYSGEEPGTVLRGTPQELARAQGAAMSLHDLRLADLFDAAVLLGYESEGICLGMQVENTEPELLTEDLTPRVRAALHPRLFRPARNQTTETTSSIPSATTAPRRRQERTCQ